MNLSATVNLILSILTVVAQLIVVYILVVLISRTYSHQLFGKPFAFIKTHGILVAFVVALVAMLGSLTFSNILGYEPCKLCWYQRIFMYPQVFLLGLALVLKEKTIVPYAILLAVIGGTISAYHFIVQLGIFPAPCSVSGYSVSCAKVFVLQFGYITIPLMALTASVLIILSLMHHKRV